MVAISVAGGLTVGRTRPLMAQDPHLWGSNDIQKVELRGTLVSHDGILHDSGWVDKWNVHSLCAFSEAAT